MLRTQPFMRDDTFLGVCQSLGDDFGFHPNLLRIALAPAVIWSPLLVFAAYMAAGVLIAILHLIVPNPAGAAPRTAVADLTEAPLQEAALAEPERQDEPELLAAA